MNETVEARLQAMALKLPERCAPRGKFLPYRREGNLIFMAGQICEWNGDVPFTGPVVTPAQDVPSGLAVQTLATGTKAAEICALNLLFHLRDACGGSFRHVRSVVRLGGFVNCLSGFDQSPAVINGASELFIAVFGERGWHARTAVGVAGLPANASVEVDAVIAVDQ